MLTKNNSRSLLRTITILFVSILTIGCSGTLTRTSVLQPQNVIAHTKVESYWKDFDTKDLAIAKPTLLIDGDHTIKIGGTTFDLLYGELSHTDTFYAVHLTQEKILYAADTVGVDVFLPVGGVALYTPGYFRLLDRLANLDFDTFVSSHFKIGNKQDFMNARALQKDIADIIHREATKYKGEIALHQNKQAFLETYDRIHDELFSKYGQLHGFDAQIIPTVLGSYINHLVGN